MPYRLPEGAIVLRTKTVAPAGGMLLPSPRSAFQVNDLIVRRGMLDSLSESTKADLGLVWEDPEPQPTPPPYQPTKADVERERDARLAGGFDHDFGDARGVHRIGTTAEDMAGWNEVTLGALANVAGGNPTATFDILTDTGPVQVTAAEWLVVMDGAKQFRQPIWNASFAITAIDPTPMDYDAANRWPA